MAMTHVCRLSLLFLLLLSACQPAAQTEAAPILATNTVLADIARHVTGDTAAVGSLLPPGADPHEYQATPADVRNLAQSRILIVNGLEYEHFLESLMESAGGERLVITASEGLPARPASEGDAALDPHLWLDPQYVIGYVENLCAGLTSAHPENAEAYRRNAEAYTAELQALDAWIASRVETVPAQNRLLVTNHASLGYFAERYGFTIVAHILPGAGSGASPRDLAAAVDRVRDTGAPAVFLGRLENPDLALQLAAETGVRVVDDLYLETLSEGPPAGSYLDMMRHNTDRIVEALR